MKARLQRLYDFLSSGLLKVKVLPDEAFGLIHGKAGVITRTDRSRVCFIGSANESRTVWVSNYELVWLDESDEGVRWVQEEFDALWSSPQAVDLAEAVVGWRLPPLPLRLSLRSAAGLTARRRKQSLRH
jgi:hypothetical protein